MQLSYVYGTCVFALSLLVHPTTANECVIGDSITGRPLIVSTSEELRAAIPANCTTIIGSITIAQNFTGPFILNDITNFTGSIASLDDVDGTGTSVPNLTSFEMNDLLSLGQDQYYGHGGISLDSVPGLLSMSMPNATFISMIQIGSFSQASFDFSNLVSSETIIITGGGIPSILLPSLAVVVGDLQISSYSVSPFPRLDLELPALINASTITISANLSRVSMPLLSLITGGVVSLSSSDYNAQGGLSIANIDKSGSTVAMIFPQLKASENTKFSGAIETILLPSLIKTQGDIYVSAFQPLAVNLTSLESVHEIVLTGNISSFDFPTLTYLDNLNIESQIHCNCAPAYTAYNTAWNLHGSNSTNNTYFPVISCFSPALTGIHSKTAKLGIGLGIGLGSVGAMIAFLYFFCSNTKSNQGCVKGRVAERPRLELDEMDLRDPPPAYDSVVATEVGSLRSERTAVEPVEGGDDGQHELRDLHRESAAGDGDVSPVTPVERDTTRPWQ